MARYSLEIKPSAARELEDLPTKKTRRLVVDRISRLADDPRPHGCETLSGQDRYRVRQGPYRIVYEIEDTTRRVRVVKVGHRKEVSRGRSWRTPGMKPAVVQRRAQAGPGEGGACCGPGPIVRPITRLEPTRAPARPLACAPAAQPPPRSPLKGQVTRDEADATRR